MTDPTIVQADKLAVRIIKAADKRTVRRDWGALRKLMYEAWDGERLVNPERLRGVLLLCAAVTETLSGLEFDRMDGSIGQRSAAMAATKAMLDAVPAAH